LANILWPKRRSHAQTPGAVQDGTQILVGSLRFYRVYVLPIIDAYLDVKFFTQKPQEINQLAVRHRHDCIKLKKMWK